MVPWLPFRKTHGLYGQADKKQIYSFQKVGIELFNEFEYIQTYSQFPKSSFYFIQIFNNSIHLNIFRYSVIQ